jgi:serine/threonine-protein kinase
MRDPSRAAVTIAPEKFEVLRPLATGGMAEIFIARTREAGRLVVIKKLHPRLSIEREYVQMFHDEAVIASRLQHPNLVEVYELGLAGDEHYIAMEYLHGRDLSRLLRKLRRERLPLLFQQAIAIVREVAAGLHYAHERVDDDGNLLNIIHRDVSPHNVILTYDGEVKVVDFGIAKASSQVSRTRTGVLKGKAAYMSPEQAMGDPLDRRTDVFSMGILLWELTTGKWLYRRRSELETLKAVVETDAPRPSTQRTDYPKDLEKIVMKALERSPEKRWTTAGELRGALDELARSWRFRPGPALVKKLMGTVFADEATAWEKSRAAGTSLAEHLIAQPEAVERWDDTGITDPDDAVAIETRRAPAESSDPSMASGGPRRTPRPTLRMQPRSSSSSSELPLPWWMRHQRALIASLIAGVAVGIILGVIALLSSGVLDDQPPGATPPPAGKLPASETLEIPAPKPEPAAEPAGADPAPDRAPDPAPLPETKVPIVYPPPLDSIRKSTARPPSRTAPRPESKPTTAPESKPTTAPESKPTTAPDISAPSAP